jgi:hypothetical protein
MIDASKIRILKNMIMRDDQPWVKWMKRKEKRLKQLWQVKGSLYGHRPTMSQRKNLSRTSLFAEIVRIWNEIGGTTKLAEKRKAEQAEQQLRKQEARKQTRPTGAGEQH